MKKPSSYLYYIPLPVCLLLLWSIGSAFKWWNSYILPSPETVAYALKGLLHDGSLWQHIMASLWRVVVGFSIAFLIAFPLGVCVGLSASIRKLTLPLLTFFRHVPPLAMLPMLILWFGIGEMSKLCIVIMATFFPIFINTEAGIGQCDSKSLEVGKAFGLSPWKEFIHIRLPFATPFIWSGFRLGLGYSWRSLIGAEMIAAVAGLGYLILDAEQMARPDIVLAGIFTIGIIGILSDWCTGKLYYYYHKGDMP